MYPKTQKINKKDTTKNQLRAMIMEKIETKNNSEDLPYIFGELDIGKFLELKKFIDNKSLKKDYDCLVVDVHGEITSEKMAVGHFLDGKASLVVGTHTHVPTNDARILPKGTGYMTDAGMCGDYDSAVSYTHLTLPTILLV